MQEGVDKIIRWIDRWKMQISVSKTKTLLISTSPTDRSADPKTMVNGKQLAVVEGFRFLGVTIDSKLHFHKHVNTLAKKGMKRVNIIRCLASKDWGNPCEIQRKLYQQYVRSTLEYASYSWSPWISNDTRKKLEVLQTAGLRSIAGLAKTCPNEFVHLEKGSTHSKTALRRTSILRMRVRLV